MVTEEVIGIAVFVAFSALFAGFWCFLLMVLSRMSGWYRLAQNSECSEKFVGKRSFFQSGRMNGFIFLSSLTFKVNEVGLFMVPIFLFRPFHEPILIP